MVPFLYYRLQLEMNDGPIADPHLLLKNYLIYHQIKFYFILLNINYVQNYNNF